MIKVQLEHRDAAPNDPDDLVDTADLHALNLEKADAVNHWLDALGATRPSTAGGLGADLSDLYAGAIRYQRLLDALLATAPEDRARAGELVVETTVELRHLAWHIRSCVGKLERLAGTLNPDDEG